MAPAVPIREVFPVYLFLFCIFHCRGQCPSSLVVQRIISEVCQVISQNSLSYTCNDETTVVSWTSSLFNGSIIVAAGSTPVLPSLTVSGVEIMIDTTGNSACVRSVLTLNGSVMSLTALNGATLTCSTITNSVLDSTTIVVPTVPGSPTLMIVPSTSCDPMSGNQVTLQWTPPTDTGGDNVTIEHYVVDVTGPAGVTCSTEPCNMISGTITFLTGLLCNTNYTVTVRAVNCRGEGNSSKPVVIRTAASVTLKCDNLHQLCPYSSAQRICTCTITGSTVRWRTNLNGIFTAGVILNSLSDMYTAMGFTVTLTNNTAGIVTSIMTYTPSSVPPNELVAVSCDIPSTNTTQTETAAITFKAVPTPPQVNAPIVSCDSVSGTYQAMLQWSGDTSNTHYQVQVTNPAGFVCPPEQCNIITTTTTITGLSCATNCYTLAISAFNCAGQGNTTNITVPVEASIVAPMISKACLIDDRVEIAWVPPSGGDSSCVTVDSYSLVIFNNTGVQLGTLMIGGDITSVSVGVANSDYYNITLTANTNCGTSTETSAVARYACTATSSTQQGCQVGLGVGIPVTFMLTAIITSLSTLLICYLCLRRGGSRKSTPPVQEPVYDPVSSGTSIEMKSNVTYGQMTSGGHAIYEAVPQ